MARSVSGFLYYILYSIIYMLPILILFIICETFHFDVLQYFARFGALRTLIGVLLLIYLFILPIYRAKLALEAYGDRDVNLWEAHGVSGVVFKTHLSFLPIVGPFFGKRNKIA